MNEAFVTSAWETVKMLSELAEHRKKRHLSSYDHAYDATLCHRVNSALVAMRVNHPSTGAARRVQDAPAAQPQEQAHERSEEGGPEGPGVGRRPHRYP
jgi:hypothetical protein